MFYLGEEKKPDRLELKLSDSFPKDRKPEWLLYSSRPQVVEARQNYHKTDTVA